MPYTLADLVTGVRTHQFFHRLEMTMATVTCFTVNQPPHSPIPPDGTLFFSIGPDDRVSRGAITVTVHPVIQMATRSQARFGGGSDHFLDIVIRNNAHVADDNGAPIGDFAIFVTSITP
jgi:hypothetical protein